MTEHDLLAIARLVISLAIGGLGAGQAYQLIARNDEELATKSAFWTFVFIAGATFVFFDIFILIAAVFGLVIGFTAILPWLIRFFYSAKVEIEQEINIVREGPKLLLTHQKQAQEELDEARRNGVPDSVIREQEQYLARHGQSPTHRGTGVGAQQDLSNHCCFKRYIWS